MNARVVELVDTKDLKSFDHCDRAGSSPASGTKSRRNPAFYLYAIMINFRIRYCT